MTLGPAGRIERIRLALIQAEAIEERILHLEDILEAFLELERKE